MKAGPSTKSKLHVYRDFAGLNSSTSEAAAEAPGRQPLHELDAMFCSPFGYLSNEVPLERVGVETDTVAHVRFYAKRETAVAYAARIGSGFELRVMDRPNASPVSWPSSAVPVSCVFNRKAVFVGGGDLAARVFDGYDWTALDGEGASGAKFCVAISRRLALAGYDQNPTEVIVSRVDREDVLAADEEDGDPSVLKAFRLNVGNMLGNADRITGLAAFETGRLAIFTNDKVLVYNAPADASEWMIDEKVTINVGTFSHNTICNVGEEMFFCSRSGVHSLRRSVANGQTLFTLPISSPVQETYRSLVAMVRDPSRISACYDRETGRYMVFFPVHDTLVYRLSLDLFPASREDEPLTGNWSLSSHAGLMHGETLGDICVFGGVGGIYKRLPEYVEGGRPAGRASLPVLWHSDFLNTKQSHSLVLFAAGDGRVTVSATDEAGRSLGNVVFDISSGGRANVLGPMPMRQFERMFQHSYTGLRLRLAVDESNKQLRIFAIGIRLREG